MNKLSSWCLHQIRLHIGEPSVFELADRILQVFGQLREGLGCGGDFLVRGGLLFRRSRNRLRTVCGLAADGVDGIDRFDDVVGTVRDGLHRVVDVAHLRVDVVDHVEDVLELDTDIADGRRTGLHLLRAGLHALDGLRRILLNGANARADLLR